MSSQVTDYTVPEEDREAALEMARGGMSDKARRHTQAFAAFYMWAHPLFDAGRIHVRNQAIVLDLSISKRFMISTDNNKPIIEAQAPEMKWIRLLPFIFAGLDREHNCLLLFAKPEAPLKEFVIAIPFDLPQKLEIFTGMRHLKIQLVTGTPAQGFVRKPGEFVVLEIRDIVPGKPKKKNKP